MTGRPAPPAHPIQGLPRTPRLGACRFTHTRHTSESLGTGGFEALRERRPCAESPRQRNLAILDGVARAARGV